jgi:ABC-type transport system involved in multi-copper enzyme maturation permease subunit
MELKFKYFHSLLLFLVSTIIITILLFTLVEPPSLTILIGFCVLLAAAIGTYYLGIRSVLKEVE